MDPQQRIEYALRLATARDDLVDFQQQLHVTRQEIAAAQHAIEDLTIDACTQRVRMKELELDEELVQKSENEAIMEKIKAQKRLIEIGGHESAVRALQKALETARRDRDATKQETQYVMAEETTMQYELVKLHAVLLKSRANSAKLQEEYSSVMREKRESDAKLKQLCLFLQTDAPLGPETTPTTTPASPSASGVVHLGDGVEVAVPEVHF